MPRPDLRALLSCACLAAAPCAVLAQTPEPASPSFWSSTKSVLGLEDAEGNYWRLMAFPYTAHFHKDEEGLHEPVYLIGVERQRADGWLWGASYFSNSFGQSSAYVYLGERVSGWSPWPQLYAEWTVGVVYGYTGAYENKIPFNVSGFAPGIVVGLGWQFTREFAAQANLLGAAGLMLGFTWNFR